ncbi:MAG: hypothetical protein RI953_103 [Pseudomonadota bacterium]|jgi:hypothetical protein
MSSKAASAVAVAILVIGNAACTSSTASLEPAMQASSLTPRGYSFLASCKWQFVGADSGKEQNCDELYMSNAMSTSDQFQLNANLAATCLSYGERAYLAREKCAQPSNRGCTCEGALNKKTGLAVDVRVYQRSVKFWPEANKKALLDWREHSNHSAYNCVCTPDVF